MKLNGAFSDWLSAPAGVPQGTRLGPWLLLVMINDLKLPVGSFLMWKFADDITISEVIPPSQQSSLQYAVDHIANWFQENRLQLNPTKCKEVQTCFKRSPPTHTPVGLDGFQFGRVNSAKVLGVTIPDLFNDIINIKDHKLVSLLPPKATNTIQLRKPKMFSVPVCKTDRFRNSFIVTHCSSL